MTQLIIFSLTVGLFMTLQVRHSYLHPSSTNKAALLFRFPRQTMDPRLQQAIENDDVDQLYSLIEPDGKLLDCAPEDPFPNTPLHDAAKLGKTRVAMEMAILKRSFTTKLNQEGYSPMHLALQNNHYHIARALVTIDPELIRVRGRGGITPLHYVAWKKVENKKDTQVLLDLLAEFLCACKSSIEDLTCQCETAVHVAIKNHNLEAFKVLFGWLKRVHLTEILNWKDEDGNTVLHIAILQRQPKIIEMLMGYTKVNAKNFQDEKALAIFQANRSGNRKLAWTLRLRGLVEGVLAANHSLAGFLSMELTLFERFTFGLGLRDKSARNIILLVAALITTATYQAALTPPGGYWQENSPNPPADSAVVTGNSSSIAVEKPHHAGNIILNGWKLYLFTALNSTVFVASVATIWITAIPLFPHTMKVYILMTFIGLAYFATFMIEFPQPDAFAGVSIMAVNLYLLGVVLVLPMILWVSYDRFRRGIDATGRRVGNVLELKDQK